MRLEKLPSAKTVEWNGPVSTVDGLPVRESGQYIDQKHSRLEYYSNMFSGGMKNKWTNRIYLELYAGPGRCLIRETGQEQLGSPLKVLDLNFTRFIFIEIEKANAEALAKRIESHPKADAVEIWNGDNLKALDQISFPSRDALTFCFIDPTGLVEMKLIEKVKRVSPKGDLLINLMDSMGLKMNWHQYHEKSGPNCKLTKMLGTDEWKMLLQYSFSEKNRRVQELFKKRLNEIGYLTEDYNVPVTISGNTHLYSLVFAGGHKTAIEFWRKSVKGTTPQSDFFDQL